MNNEKLLEIIKALNDNRSKLSALYSLYNSSLIVAEDNRQTLGTYFEQIIDFKNEANMISNSIFNAKKTERDAVISKNMSKIKRINNEINEVNENFKSSCKKYKLALQECGSLKTEYKHAVSELCKEFKACIDDNTDAIIIKGYKQQIKIIKAILEKIELLICDYNIKKNKVDEDNVKFDELFNSVNSLIVRLKTA